MKITNRMEVPELIFKYLENDFYDFVPKEKSISATSLLKPLREVILTKRHNDEIEVEAVDRLWSLFGQGIHAILEKGNLSDQQEERINVEFNGWEISGKFDIIHNNQITDFKTTSAYTLVYNDRVKDWQDQLSIYRFLYFKKYSKELSPQGKIIAILRDWAEYKLTTKGYPKAPIVEITLDLLPFDKVEELIKKVTTDIDNYSKLKDDDLPQCTIEETWNGKKCGKYCNVARFCDCKREAFGYKSKEKKP